MSMATWNARPVAEREIVTERVEVAAAARLHLGFLDLNGSLGRRFGSLGVALDAPCTRLTIQRSAVTRVDGPERERTRAYLSAMLTHLGLSEGHWLRIAEAIPAHSGLGSGTQLALAVAAAVRRLHGLALDPRADARTLGRGRRSGIGIGLFEAGGLVVDGGVGAENAPPPLLARLAVPADWRVLLVLDQACQGLAGEPEVAAFRGLSPMPEEISAKLCRLALMQALPAVAEDNLEDFGAAVSEIQALNGDHFAPVQGGRFASPRIAAALAAMAEMGAAGIGQSSWGPTGFAFVRGEAAAEHVRAILTRSRVAEGLDIHIRQALNRGAAIVET